MGRPGSDGISVTEARVKRPNGDVHVYERRLAHDPVAQKTHDIGWKLKGKIPAGGTDMVPARPKRSTTRAGVPAGGEG